MKEQYVRHLFKMTTKHTHSVIEATIEHLCYGESQDSVAEKYDISQSTVGRAVSKIKKLDELTIEAIIIKIT